MDQKRLKHDDYTVAWICPLVVEQVAALEMLDEEHQRLPQPEHDHNLYDLGSINGHNVVVAQLPLAGNCFAATVVAQMRNTYPRLRFGLLVGIGGGVPTRTDEGPIRLGHVVVSEPTGQHSGAVQYDHGKAETNKFVRTGYLAPPPNVLLNAARRVQVQRRRTSTDPLAAHLERIDTTKSQFRRYKRPQADQDYLYEPDYIHLDKGKSCKRCGCDASKRVNRDSDDSDDSDDNSDCNDGDDRVVVHRGTIASGEAVMRNGLQRDTLAQEHNILCFEMEAAGALNDFPCLVIRGISDYSDSHKNDKWHGYAAAVAAAYARELFVYMPVEEVKQCKVAEEVLQELVQNTTQIVDNSEDSRLKAWLKPIDASINYANAANLRHPSTGRWFLRSNRYTWLKNTPNARLWLRGIPGSGKTVLASTVIEDLKLDEINTPGSAVIYFFFSFSDVSTQKLEDMMRSLVFQLAASHVSTKVLLMKLYKSCASGHQQPQIKELVSVFGQMMGELRSVTVVLDALDESREIRDLLQWVTSSPNQHSKFMLLSRSERDIEEALVSWLPPDCVITLEEEPTGDDLKAYIHHRLKTESNLSRMKSMHEEISDVLVAKAAGMFRWVYCQLQELSTCMDKPAVRQVLQTLPKDLNETYDRILQNIPQTCVHNAIKLLQLLAFSKRPLLLEEVVDAIATEPEIEPPFILEDRISPAVAVIGYCPSLVRLTAIADDDYNEHLYDVSTRRDLEGRLIIQLAHFSVQEYLLLSRVENPHHGSFAEPVANAAITRICLAYLWTSVQASRAQQIGSEFSLTNYATRYWLKHARIAGDGEDTTFTWAIRLFTNDNFMRDMWKLNGYGGLGYFHRTHALYYAALGGLYRSVEYLLEAGADVNRADGIHNNALQASCISGSTETVRVLIDHGGQLNPEDGDQNALQITASTGNVEILRVLLEHGAPVDATDRASRTALYVASKNGHTNVVRTLLEYGADVNLHGIWGTALEEACGGCFGTFSPQAYGSDHARIVRMLLDHGADVNGHMRDDKPVLSIASASGRAEIVQMLLDEGASVNAEDAWHGTAVCAAAYYGHKRIVQMLLIRGADVNARSGPYGHALQSACHPQLGRIDRGIVQALLDSGADPNARGIDDGNALCAASSIGDVEVVRMLIHGGADVNATCGKHDFALDAAARCGRVEVLMVLLDNGAISDTQGRPYRSALMGALHKGHIEVAEILDEADHEWQLAMAKASCDPLLKRSASEPCLDFLTETQSTQDDLVIDQPTGTRRYSFDL